MPEPEHWPDRDAPAFTCGVIIVGAAILAVLTVLALLWWWVA
jgi:hypothetical protein